MNLAFTPERIETWPLAKLQPYTRNANRGGPGNSDHVLRWIA